MASTVVRRARPGQGVLDPRRHGAVHLAYFGDHHPAGTVVGVTELTFPGQVIEISFVVDTKLPA